jgi:hypothetical protein
VILGLDREVHHIGIAGATPMSIADKHFCQYNLRHWVIMAPRKLWRYKMVKSDETIRNRNESFHNLAARVMASFAAVLAVGLVLSCQQPSDANDNQTNDEPSCPVWADVVGAKGLFIAGTVGTTSALHAKGTSDGGALMKILPDGSTAEVLFTDDLGYTVGSDVYAASALTLLSERWVIMKLGSYGADIPIESQLVLVDLETGNVYSAAPTGLLDAMEYVAASTPSGDNNSELIPPVST